MLRAFSRRLPPALFAAALALLAVGSAAREGRAPRLGPADLDALEALARAVARADAAAVPTAFTDGLAALDLGRSEPCRIALRDVVGTRGEVRAMAALQAAQSCRVACIDELGRQVTARGALTAHRGIVEACERAAGADPVFTRALASLREEMEPAHYLLHRQLLGEVRAALHHDGSSRSRAIWEDLEAALPALAAGLVRLEREVHAPRSQAGEPAADPLSTGHDPRHRFGPPLVVLAGGKLLFDGATVGRIASILKDDPDEGSPLAALADRLGKWRAEVAGRLGAEPPRRVVVRADGDVPFETVGRILRTCESAGFDQPDFAVPLHDHAFRRVRWSGVLFAPLVLAIEPEPARVEWEDEPDTGGARPLASAAPANGANAAPDARLGSGAAAAAKSGASAQAAAKSGASAAATATLEIAADGLLLTSRTGASRKIPDVGGRIDEPQLARTLEWLHKQKATALRVEVLDDVPHQRFLAALNLALRGGFARLTVDASTDGATDQPAARAPDPAKLDPLAAMLARAPGASPRPAPVAKEAAAAPKDPPRSEPPAPRPRDVIAEPPEVQGEGDSAVVAREVSRHLDDLRACYDRELAVHPALAGRIVVDFTIHEAGGVRAAAVKFSTTSSPALEQCFVDALRRWEFSPPKRGMLLVIEAFTLQPPR